MNDRGAVAKPSRHTGRPPLPAEDARRNRVVTMVTDDELRMLRDRADAGNTTISSFVHDLLRQYLSK